MDPSSGQPEQINVGRKYSGGIFGGLFGNPVKEKVVSEQYRFHIRRVLEANPNLRQWLKDKLRTGAVLYCPGCGVASPTCHARILEQEL
jgi:hypothetical protein